MVDENRIEGTARNIGGKIQDAVGAVTGDKDNPGARPDEPGRR